MGGTTVRLCVFVSYVTLTWIVHSVSVRFLMNRSHNPRSIAQWQYPTTNMCTGGRDRATSICREGTVLSPDSRVANPKSKIGNRSPAKDNRDICSFNYI